jgi:hypothetical protein
VCGVVRIKIRGFSEQEREQEAGRLYDNIGGARVMIVDFCDPCRRAYEEHEQPPTGLGEG